MGDKVGVEGPGRIEGLGLIGSERPVVRNSHFFLNSERYNKTLSIEGVNFVPKVADLDFRDLSKDLKAEKENSYVGGFIQIDDYVGRPQRIESNILLNNWNSRKPLFVPEKLVLVKRRGFQLELSNVSSTNQPSLGFMGLEGS
tara:strand:+ start:22 stop:450 length:429 start_codon:yes stop_codon:yes gene_type:complete